MTIYTSVTSNKLPSEVFCPTSKSYANRSLIIAALKTQEIELRDIPEAKDVIDLIDILKNLNVEIEKKDTSLRIINSFPECETLSEEAIVLPGSEGGTTIRFILPLLALGSNEYHLPMEGRLSKRPLNPLLKGLEQLGAAIDVKGSIIKIKGPITLPDSISVDCSETTQFASAMKLLTTKKLFKVELENFIFSKKYIQMTEFVLAELQDKDTFTIPPDFSSLGYLLAYSALNQKLLVKNVLESDQYQADSKMIEVLDKIGTSFNFTPCGLEIEFRNKKLNAFDIDGAQCIDLVPTLIFLASFCKGTSQISNVKFLKDKESDRLTEMRKLLNIFGITYNYSSEKDILSVYGLENVQNREGLKIETANDHRIVMVATLFLKMFGGGEVAPKMAVSKSFPQFFRLF